MRRYFIECCFGMAWSKRPFTLANIKETVRRWEREWEEIHPTIIDNFDKDSNKGALNVIH